VSIAAVLTLLKRSLIIESLKNARDIVISHYHRGHHPLVNANLYQLYAKKIINTCPHARFWTKGTNDLSANQINRARALSKHLGRTLVNVKYFSQWFGKDI